MFHSRIHHPQQIMGNNFLTVKSLCGPKSIFYHNSPDVRTGDSAKELAVIRKSSNNDKVDDFKDDEQVIPRY